MAAGVLTGGIARGHRTVAKLEAETSYINNSNLTPVGITFGGYKISGIGRENSHYAIDSYSQVKSVLVEMGDVEAPY